MYYVATLMVDYRVCGIHASIFESALVCEKKQNDHYANRMVYKFRPFRCKYRL